MIRDDPYLLAPVGCAATRLICVAQSKLLNPRRKVQPGASLVMAVTALSYPLSMAFEPNRSLLVGVILGVETSVIFTANEIRMHHVLLGGVRFVRFMDTLGDLLRRIASSMKNENDDEDSKDSS
ncbi:MAG: hypothetical protein KDB27_01440 [Planctomycetales bacterium]|nr:hypothetical protein [Planctomycetales bacterium]